MKVAQLFSFAPAELVAWASAEPFSSRHVNRISGAGPQNRRPAGNSWDCFATTVTASQAKAQADHIAERLLRYGWQYRVLDAVPGGDARLPAPEASSSLSESAP